MGVQIKSAKKELRDMVEKYAIQQGMESEFEKDVQSFTLHIAEQAVGELIQGEDWVDMDSLDRLVSRIKTLIEE